MKTVWEGEHLVIMTRPGGSYSDNGGRCYVKAEHYWVSKSHVGMMLSSLTAWQIRRYRGDLGEGRLTKAMIAKAAELDKQWPTRLAEIKAEEAAELTAEAAKIERAARWQKALHAMRDAKQALLDAALTTDDMPTLAVLAGEYKTAQNALDNMEETS